MLSKDRIFGSEDFFFEFREDWSQLFRGCNWYTFQFAHVEFEWEKIMGDVEATIMLFGVGVRWRWNFKETPTTRRIATALEEIESGEAVLTPLSDYTSLKDYINSDD